MGPDQFESLGLMVVLPTTPNEPELLKVLPLRFNGLQVMVGNSLKDLTINISSTKKCLKRYIFIHRKKIAKIKNPVIKIEFTGGKYQNINALLPITQNEFRIKTHRLITKLKSSWLMNIFTNQDIDENF